MSLMWLLALLVVLSPLLLALLIVGIVVVLAVRRVEPDDVPSVLGWLGSLLELLARRFPRIRDVRLMGGSIDLEDHDDARTYELSTSNVPDATDEVV